jgi:hypothetical protein
VIGCADVLSAVPAGANQKKRPDAACGSAGWSETWSQNFGRVSDCGAGRCAYFGARRCSCNQ